MKEIYKIPQEFFRLFTSKNRYIYMEALTAVYDEYLYNDYFLTRETCITIIEEHFSNRTVDISADLESDELESYEPMPSRILSKLLQFAWLRRIEDYTSFTTNIILPDYASVFIEAFKTIEEDDMEDTDLYIQNVYANIYSFYHDKKAGLGLLKTALVNTKKLNRALQELLHNMDKFFASLLEKNNYEDLLNEHLNVYVENIVNRKYSLLKTSDNFYIYKNDIKTLLREIGEDEERLYVLREKLVSEGKTPEKAEEMIAQTLDYISQGIVNMEKRIAHIDTEHTKYVRATASRLEYLLSQDTDTQGNILFLLNRLSDKKAEEPEMLRSIAETVQLNTFGFLSKESFYQKRGKRKNFEDTVAETESKEVELSKEEILSANKSSVHYSQKQMDDFVVSRMKDGVYDTEQSPVTTQEEFELLILAYDACVGKKSPFEVTKEQGIQLENEKFVYPKLIFTKKGDRRKEADE